MLNTRNARNRHKAETIYYLEFKKQRTYWISRRRNKHHVSITVFCLAPSEVGPIQKPRQTSTVDSPVSPRWRQSNSNQQISSIPGDSVLRSDSQYQVMQSVKVLCSMISQTSGYPREMVKHAMKHMSFWCKTSIGLYQLITGK